MCTMTWFVDAHGYQLFFNRDERLTRQRAQEPALFHANGVQYMSPTDTDAGGTWIAVNEYGVTVCLLNHYQFEQISTYKNWISRGEIVRRFATTDQLVLAEKRFLKMSLTDFRAFRMFLIEPSGDNCLMVWDGHTARVEHNVTAPKSSSSVDAKHVKEARKKLFAELQLASSTTTQDYLNFHASHLPARSKESVCMHRDDAKTVSFSFIQVNQDQVSFRYADGSPCESELGQAHLLPLTLRPPVEQERLHVV